MSPLLRHVIPSCLLALAVGSAAKASLVLHEEIFSSPSPGNVSVSNIGWQAFVFTSATSLTTTSPVTGERRAGVASSQGFGPGNGYLFAQNSGAGTAARYFLFEEGLSIDATAPDLTWTWRQHASGDGYGVRLVLQIGGSWYATDATYANAGATQTGAFSEFPAEGVEYTLPFALTGPLWRDLTFVAGSLLDVAATGRGADLPVGPITGVGFYVDSLPSSSTTIRLDLLQATTSIPEPGTASLLLAGSALLASRFRPTRRLS